MDPSAGGFGQPPAGGFGGAPVPPASSSNTGKIVGIGCVVLLVLACCGFGGFTLWKGKQGVDAVTSTETDSTCGKAAACCEALIDAQMAQIQQIPDQNARTTAEGQMQQARTACQGLRAYGAMGPNGEQTCEQARTQYRTSLQAVPGATVPATCQ